MQDLQKNIDLEQLRFVNGRISQQKLGDILGVSKQHISAIEKGKAKLTKENLEKLKVAGLIFIDDDCVDIPVKGEVSASMGTGVEVYNENSTGTYQVGRKLLKDIGASQQFTEMIFATGDSMEPTIFGGDSLLVDTSKKEVYDGKIYCLRIDGLLYVKRLQKIPPSTLVIVSDNSKYKVYEIDLAEKLEYDFSIIGEVLWWGRVAK